MQINALRSANFAKLSSNSSTSDEYWVTSISAGTPAGYCLSQLRSMVFPLWLFPCFLAGPPCFGQYCECRRRWQAAARYRRISAIWNNSAERQENCRIPRLRGPLTSRLGFALGFSGSLRLGRLRRGLVSSGDRLGGGRLSFGRGGRLGGSLRLGVRMPDRHRLGCRLCAGFSLGRRSVRLLRCNLRFLAALCRRLLVGIRRNGCDQSRAGLGRASIDRNGLGRLRRASKHFRWLADRRLQPGGEERDGALAGRCAAAAVGGDDVGVLVGGRPLALAVAHLVAQVRRRRS